MTPTRTLAQPRFARGALLAFAGLTAFSVAACGTHGDTNAASTRSSAPTTSSATHGEHNEKGHVSGLIASVSGNTVEVTTQNGNATVSFGQSTKVSEISAAQLSDVTAGSCIAAMTPPDSNPPTARRVMMWPSADGSCVREHPREQQSTSPAPGSGKRPEHEGIRGTVASVSGNTITVTGTDPNGTAPAPPP